MSASGRQRPVRFQALRRTVPASASSRKADEPCYVKIMATVGIEHFPQPEDWTEEDLASLGYRRFALSIYDHWLTPDEWEVDPFVSFQRARESGREAEFQQQRRQFIDFYKALFCDGVFRLTGSRLKPQVTWHFAWDRRLKRAVQAIVEDRFWASEFYVPTLHLRIISADDRTDIFLLENAADEGRLRKMAAEHCLHMFS